MWKALGILCLLAGFCTASKRPNIVFILCDDVGWNDVSFHGSDQIPTPNIDALAYSGTILNNHYVQPICTPTRAALMTGRYPSNIGMQAIPIGGAEPQALPDMKILPQYLKDLGYKTHIVGKWHLGYYKTKYTPTHRGFDHHMGYYNGLIGYFDHVYDDPDPSLKEVCREGQKSVTLDFSGRHLYGLDFHRDGVPAWDLTGKYATDVFTEEAVNVINNHNDSDPLFLYLAHLACHAGNWGQNLEAPLDEINKFTYIQDPNRRTYAAMISKLDKSVGKVMAALKSRNMLQDSIVVFLSDNGGPTVLRDSWQTPASNYPFRGVKLTQWEGGVRTPAVLWTPFLSKHSRIASQMMHVSDWLPTLYTAAGGKAEDLAGLKLDGVDQWSSLVDNTKSARDEMLVYIDEVRNVSAVRRGDMKLVMGMNLLGYYDGYSGDSGVGKNYPQYDLNKILKSDAGVAITSINPLPEKENILQKRKEVKVNCGHQKDATPCDTFRNKQPCLFNITSDPCETNDLSQTNPDTARELLELLKKYEETLVNAEKLPYNTEAADPAKFNNTWVPWGDYQERPELTFNNYCIPPKTYFVYS